MMRKYASPLLISALTILIAQGGAQSLSTPNSAGAPTAFDVASIRPAADRSSQPGWVGVRITGGTFEARSMSLKGLVWYAYASRVPKQEMVSGGEGWIESQQWDIMAKIDDPSFAGLSSKERTDRMRPMVRALLEQRFQLKFHTEMRPTPVYVLVQAKGGAKVKEVPPAPAVEGDWVEAMKHYREENPGKPLPGAITCSDNGCTARAMTISAALGQIQGSSHADRPVIDETGLKGYYDFFFRQPRNDDDGAMREIEADLGVRFEARKVDLTTYVIDSAEKPSVN